MNKHISVSMALLLGAMAAAFSLGARADSTTSNDDFTQASDPNSWQTFNGACLTAGDGTGSIPACVGLPYYKGQVQVGGNSGYLGLTTNPGTGIGQAGDPAGKGALRFTNGWTSGKSGFLYGYNQAGSIISSGTPFPTGAGLQVIFKTITYRGDNSGGHGADGMGFFLMDGSLPPYDTGAVGGSLGYTCTDATGNNDPTPRADGSIRGYDGVLGGYIGLGIDEYGNFLNQGDNTATGFGYVPGRIGLRGRGSVTWGWLNANYPTQYPSTLTALADATSVTKARAAVHDTCRTGFLWDYSNPNAPFQTTTTVNDYKAFANPVVLSTLLPGKTIAAESAMTRGAATPITYSLKITQDGILSLSVAYGSGNYLPVISKQSITAANGVLPPSFRFGFTGSTGGSNNVHEILCFQAAPADLAGTSVGVNQQEAAKISSGTQAYLAFYYPSNWTGRLTANNITFDSSTQSIGVAAVANWDAQCNLSGVLASQTCASTTAAGPVPAQGPTARTMLTYNGSSGIPFQYASLNTAQQNTIDALDLPLPYNANRVNYLRGDRSNEISSVGVGLYRARDGVLGDIVDSSPTWVGPPSARYTGVWSDLLVSSDSMTENTGTQNYTQFLATAGIRTNVVYNGANDGFLHGFRSGSFDASGTYNNTTTPNDGQEVLAFMPNAVLQTIHNSLDSTLDYSNSQYSHNFYVDATPEADDVFYNKVWHTWLVGGLGAGGSAIYALDVTDPSTFSEANASSLVMAEWSAATISCQGYSTCGSSLGNTYGTPIVRRLHDGKWAIIFGNGFGSVTGDAGIFVMLISPSNGTTQSSSTYYLSTGKGSGTIATPCVLNCDGIAYVTSADLDGDHITDYVYAGDVLGNLWRFDLTSPTESSWAVTAGGPLFTTASGQPITTKVIALSVPQSSGNPRLMLEFGTGQKTPQTNTTPTSYATGSQALYGIWDWNLAAWNTASSSDYLSLASGAATLANLTTQTLTVNADTTLDITSNVVCWSGSSTCSGGAPSNTKFGFKVTLPGTQEQLVFNPLLYSNALIVNTTIPATNSPTSCQVNHDTGNTIAINAVTGGAVGSAATGSFFKNTTDTSAAGALTNGTGTPAILTAGGISFLLTQSLGDGSFQSVPGSGAKTIGNCTGPSCFFPLHVTSATSKRLTWIERR